MDLNTIWFLLVGVLITGYAILDGFDLGAGVLHLFAKSDAERRANLHAVEPVWDGNEVWLLTGGGALFAAFPVVYATVFSGFYLALVLVLAALIARAVALEFRNQVNSPRWQAFWDRAFGIGSGLPAVLFGVAVGNVLRGVPIDAAGHYTGTFLGLLNPYALLLGILSLAMFLMHGALYLALSSEGEQRERMQRWASGAWMAYAGMFVVASLASVSFAPHLFAGVLASPLWWVLVVLFLAGLVAVPVFLKAGATFRAMVASSACILAMIGLAALGMFPRLVASSTDLANSLTIYNSASTPRTQTVMLVIALVGMPIVIGYTIWIYRVFRGKAVAAA